MAEIQIFPPEAYYAASQTHEVLSGNYPDGAPFVKHINDLGSLRGLLLRPTSVESFMTGMWLADAAAERGTPFKTLVLPFIPAARQDRINKGYEADYLFTLKSVAREINMRNFDKVVVLDPHSEVAPALIDRSDVVHAADIFAKPAFGDIFLRQNYDAVIAPDAGAAKRAAGVAEVLGIPVIQASKRRDVATGKLSGFAVDLPEGEGNYLVVDDICDGGGTFIGLADAAHASEYRATLDLFVTHGVFSKGTGPLMTRYRKVFTTDSTNFDKGNAITLNALPILLKR